MSSFGFFPSLTPIFLSTRLEKHPNGLALPAVAGRLRPTITPTRLVSRTRQTSLAEPFGFGPAG
jgi:hypothetical protein